jgi:hypothetical protein
MRVLKELDNLSKELRDAICISVVSGDTMRRIKAELKNNKLDTNDSVSNQLKIPNARVDSHFKILKEYSNDNSDKNSIINFYKGGNKIFKRLYYTADKYNGFEGGEGVHPLAIVSVHEIIAEIQETLLSSMPEDDTIRELVNTMIEAVTEKEKKISSSIEHDKEASPIIYEMLGKLTHRIKGTHLYGLDMLDSMSERIVALDKACGRKCEKKYLIQTNDGRYQLAPFVLRDNEISVGWIASIAVNDDDTLVLPSSEVMYDVDDTMVTGLTVGDILKKVKCSIEAFSVARISFEGLFSKDYVKDHFSCMGALADFTTTASNMLMWDRILNTLED